MKNNKVKFTIKRKIAYFLKIKRKKRLKTFFFSLGFITISAFAIAGLILLVESAKKNEN